MDPWFVTGFADAESCFSLNVGLCPRNKKFKIGWEVKPSFQIGLHQKDKALLEQILSYFSAGNISQQGSQSLQFRVQSVKDLKLVINHFDKYPLISQKWADYQLFKQAIRLMEQKEHLTEAGLAKIVAIKASMNWGLPEKLKAAFPDILPVTRPVVVDPEIQDPNWLSGFASGECCIQIRIFKSITTVGEAVRLEFRIVQHSKDEQLMRSLIQYWDCGNVYKFREAIEFRIHKFSDITYKIIPFFNKYPIHGIKALDYADFVKAADIMKEKGHLTAEGLDQIRQIKAGMNKGRPD